MREHGLRATYGKGCRCHPCTEANREYKRRYRSRTSQLYVNVEAAKDPWGLPQITYPALEAWREQALCGQLVRSGAAETAWWTDLKGRHLSKARAICARCEVRTDCLAWARRLPEPAGLWGGLIPAERNQL